jgi:hypothetical protein
VLAVYLTYRFTLANAWLDGQLSTPHAVNSVQVLRSLERKVRITGPHRIRAAASQPKTTDRAPLHRIIHVRHDMANNLILISGNS